RAVVGGLCAATPIGRQGFSDRNAPWPGIPIRTEPDREAIEAAIKRDLSARAGRPIVQRLLDKGFMRAGVQIAAAVAGKVIFGISRITSIHGTPA
ncbi:MAG TPA: hypothetical protein VJ572_08130, partial [Azonexus sp.]|nr:hypothetical protein [Azonexus sp.]